jgi:hypothetical protein
LFISTWGSLRHAANIAFVCLQVWKNNQMIYLFSLKYLTSKQKAADLNINPLAYRKLAQQQIHYALGDTGRSYVVGYGVNPPLKPHHASRFE